MADESRPGFNDPIGRERPAYHPPLPPDAPQSVSTDTVSSREADGRLVDMVGGQLITVAREMSSFKMWLIIVGMFCMLSSGFCIYKSYEVSKVNEQTKKQIWELKKALSLQFSDERSRGKSQAEMP